MNLFQHSNGFVFAFGFDMAARKPDPRRICWCDPNTGEWEIKPTNLAGNYNLSYDVAPEFVRESDGKIVAYQPGRCIELALIGAPYVWSLHTLQAEGRSASQAA